MIPRALLVSGLVLGLGIPNALIVHKQWVVGRGKPVLLELAPVDPRSLMQGDYMQLRYAIERQLPQTPATHDGKAIVRLDENGVASYVRTDDGSPLQPGELALRFRVRGGVTSVGSDAFHFEEGQARCFEGARYGELRAAESGTSVLVGLRDAERIPLVGGCGAR